MSDVRDEDTNFDLELISECSLSAPSVPMNSPLVTSSPAERSICSFKPGDDLYLPETPGVGKIKLNEINKRLRRFV